MSAGTAKTLVEALGKTHIVAPIVAPRCASHSNVRPRRNFQKRNFSFFPWLVRTRICTEGDALLLGMISFNSLAFSMTRL
jgi:hypothetical protein